MNYISELPRELGISILYYLNKEEDLLNVSSEFSLLDNDEFWRYKLNNLYFIREKRKKDPIRPFFHQCEQKDPSKITLIHALKLMCEIDNSFSHKMYELDDNIYDGWIYKNAKDSYELSFFL